MVEVNLIDKCPGISHSLTTTCDSCVGVGYLVLVLVYLVCCTNVVGPVRVYVYDTSKQWNELRIKLKALLFGVYLPNLRGTLDFRCSPLRASTARLGWVHESIPKNTPAQTCPGCTFYTLYVNICICFRVNIYIPGI